MEAEKVIEQLESLKEYCEDMRVLTDIDCTWLKDTVALEIAIKAIEKGLQATTQSKPIRKISITKVYQD